MAEKPLKRSKSSLQHALTKAGFSRLQLQANLGFFTWQPPLDRFRYKSIARATTEEIQSYTMSDVLPTCVIPVSDVRLPVRFQSGLPKQVVAQKYPYANIGVAALLHAKSRCDLKDLDFFLGCSALQVLSAEKKSGKKDGAPYLVQKVPGTDMIAIRYNLTFGQDYTVPGFQFERLMTGKNIADSHDIGLTEHVQLVKVGPFYTMMSAEVDAVDSDGNPAELKLMKSGHGGIKTFLQMVGSGSLTLHKGRNNGGILTHVNVLHLEDMAEAVAKKCDAAALENKVIRNLERIREWNKQGHFDNGKVYRIDFNPHIEIHPVQQNLFPPEVVMKEVLSLD